MALNTIYDKDYLTPPSISRELHSNLGASAYTLGDAQRFFKGSIDFTIHTAPTGGTLLVEDTDYTLTVNSFFTTEAGFNVYESVTITNVTYQTGNLYITYKPVASLNEASFMNQILSDIATLQSQLGTSKNVDNTNYTILDDDGFDKFYLDGSSGTCTVTLPTLSANQDRKLLFLVIDDTNLCKFDGEGAETINALLEIELPKAGDHVQIIGQSSEWKIINENITCQLRLDTHAGEGSTDSCIVRFTNSRDNYGNIFSENHSTGYNGNAEGLEITASKAGKYAISFSLQTNTTNIGLSLNSSQLSTAIGSINVQDRIAFSNTGTNGQSVSWTGYLDIGDVIRPHFDSDAVVAAAQCAFTATYLGS